MPKILVVFGTRPEAIKMAPVIRELRAREIPHAVCVTAQHRDMLDQVLSLFGIKPDYDLDVMRRGQSPAQVASAVFDQLRSVIASERPDWVLVQGDTTTAVSAAMCAFYAGCRVAHVEAGLRTHDKRQPFPEEMNRQVISRVADLHFAPTQRALLNLTAEGIDPLAITITGNTIVDALQWALLGSDAFGLQLSSVPDGKKLVVVTAHRRENWGTPLQNICSAIWTLSERDDVHFWFLVHPNPVVTSTVYPLLSCAMNVTLSKPFDYQSMVHLVNRSYLVLTDSGGLQEEAPALGKPVLVLRDTTERPEGIAAGVSKLVGTDAGRIFEETARLLDDAGEYAKMARKADLYGDGRAAVRIVDALVE